MVRKSLVAAAAVLLPFAAQAAIVLSATGLSGTVSTQNFDVNAGTDVAAANQFAGVTFGTGLFTTNGFVAGAGMGGGGIANFYPCCASPTSFSFDSNQSEVAFGFLTNDGWDIAFEALLGGSVVDSATYQPGSAGQWVVFTGVTVDEIRITSHTANGSFTGWVLDNLQTRGAAVPEPASLALVGLALAGIGASRRRNRAG